MSKRYYLKRIFIALSIIAFAFACMLVSFAIAGNRSGNVAIYIDKQTNTKTLSLSESPDLKNPTGILYAPGLVNAWDEIADNIPTNYADLIKGDTSVNDGYDALNDRKKKNYISYTFYVFNSGSESLKYRMEMVIDGVEKNLDESIRVRLVDNNEEVPPTFAKMGKRINPSTGEINDEPEVNTKPFESDKIICSREYENVKPGDVRKYNLLFWIEADDPDTTNDKIGGSISMSIKFSVIG